MSKKDNYYMELATVAGKQSKDPNTKVGQCIQKDGRVLSLGWNGAPRNFPDELVPTCRDTTKPLKEQKYPYIVHQELNAILNYWGDHSNLIGSTVYVTYSPCPDCQKQLIQSGVKKIVYKEEYHKADSFELSNYLLDTCGVEHYKMEE